MIGGAFGVRHWRKNLVHCPPEGIFTFRLTVLTRN